MGMDRYLLELDSETKNRLERLKAHPEEAYSEVINRLIDSYEDDSSLTKEEVEEIRQALRDLKEGRFVAHGLGREEPAPPQEQPESPTGDPQAVKDMEALFSGTAQGVQDAPPPLEQARDAPPGAAKLSWNDPDIARYRSIDVDSTDSTDIREVDPYDRRGRARTPHLDNL